MQKEVAIKAVIGFSGTANDIQEPSMMVFYCTLTTSTSSTPSDPPSWSGIFFLELRLSCEGTIARFQVLRYLLQQSRYLEMVGTSWVPNRVSQASLPMWSSGILKPDKLSTDSNCTKLPWPASLSQTTRSFWQLRAVKKTSTLWFYSGTCWWFGISRVARAYMELPINKSSTKSYSSTETRTKWSQSLKMASKSSLLTKSIRKFSRSMLILVTLKDSSLVPPLITTMSTCTAGPKRVMFSRLTLRRRSIKELAQWRNYSAWALQLLKYLLTGTY